MALTYQDINAFTTNHIVPKSNEVIFKNDPLLTRLLSRRRMKFGGGLAIQRPLTYGELACDFFSRGDSFDTGYRYTETAMVVYPKFVGTSIALLGTDDVINRGEDSAFSIVASKFENASFTMAKKMATSIYLDGQGAMSNTRNFDGLAAWIDDGSSNATYTGLTDIRRSFSSVGSITRSDIQAGPSSGDVSLYANVNGLNAYTNRNLSTFDMNEINKAYTMATWGPDTPDLIVTTDGGYNKIWNNTTPMQRYTNDKNDLAGVGYTSFKFNGADVVTSKYMQDAIGATYGLMLGLNTKYIEMWVSDNPRFQFGFTGFKEAQGNIDYVGQYVFSGNLLCPNPRSCFKIVGTSIAS